MRQGSSSASCSPACRPSRKKGIVLPWDHGSEGGKRLPTRMCMYNAPIAGKQIAKAYTKPQQELIGRIPRAICSDEEGHRRITRIGSFDSCGSRRASCGTIASCRTCIRM
jgi:hypothetical protein